MSFLDLAAARYSVRKFKSDPVSEADLAKILEAGRLAPTAVNYQPQRILVINSPEALAKLPECTPYHFSAPLALMICYDKSVSYKRTKYDNKEGGEIDASIVTTHMLLEVADLGLGATWVMSFDPAKVRELYHVPENYEIVAMLMIGHPSEEAKPAHLHGKRLPLTDTVRYNDFAC